MRKARMRGESDSIRLSYGCVGEPLLPRVRAICKVREPLEVRRTERTLRPNALSRNVDARSRT
jgi:hypothetical protein